VPVLGRLGGRGRLGQSSASEIEHRVTWHHESIGAAGGDGLTFAPGERLYRGGGVRLVNRFVMPLTDDFARKSPSRRTRRRAFEQKPVRGEEDPLSSPSRMIAPRSRGVAEP